MATTAACQMIGALGMGSSLVSLEAVSGGDPVAKVLSHEDARSEVERLLAAARDGVRDMLGRSRHVVEALRDALLERDELVGHEIVEVIEAAESGRRTYDLTPS